MRELGRCEGISGKTGNEHMWRGFYNSLNIGSTKYTECRGLVKCSVCNKLTSLNNAFGEERSQLCVYVRVQMYNQLSLMTLLYVKAKCSLYF